MLARTPMPGSADPQNTISQQQLCCGGQESEPDGRTHLQNCDTQEHTNCCTTVQLQGTGETTCGDCSLVWSCYLKKDNLIIEKVQRRVSKMIPSVSAIKYEERQKHTELISLENHRLRADLTGEPPTQAGSHWRTADSGLISLENHRLRVDLTGEPPTQGLISLENCQLRAYLNGEQWNQD